MQQKNRNNPIFCRVAQELSLVAVAGIIALDFANVNTAFEVAFPTYDYTVFTPLSNKLERL
jgi:hypothetical protein